MDDQQTAPATATLLSLVAQTPVHVGGGEPRYGVDLPVQREGHTDWPVIPGSGLKGALKSKGRQCRMPDLAEVFGPDAGPDAPKYEGALAVSDAQLLLLPVRSSHGHFKLVTCPHALERCDRARERVGMDPVAGEVPRPASLDEALTLCLEKVVYLEEMRVRAKAKPAELLAWMAFLAELQGAQGDEAMLARLAEPIVIVTDDLFAWFARFALPVAPHVKLKENKTVDGRGFWYEETMAPDTLLIATLHANSSRAPDSALGPEQIMGSALGLFSPGSANPDGSNPGGWRYLQVGGSETTGAGWMRVRFMGPATPAPGVRTAGDFSGGRT